MRTSEIGRKINKLSIPALAILGGIAVAQRLENRQLRWRNRQYDKWLQFLERSNEKLNANNQELAYQATHDKLTGLLNVAGLEAALAKCKEPVALLYIDGTNQKAVNDRISHQRGDEAIIGTAGVITTGLRSRDVAARIGGDEFLVILSRKARESGQPTTRTPQEILDKVTSRIVGETASYLSANPDLVEKAGFNIAVGGVIWQQGVTIESLRLAAEANMYVVKGGQHGSGGQYRPS